MTAKAAISIYENPIPCKVAETKTVTSEAEDREQRVAWLAYSIAEKRQFEPGHELEDWLEAESAEAETI